MSSEASPLSDRGELPREIDRVLHAPVHSLPGERRHQMRGVARQEHPSYAPSVGDAGMKCVDGLPLDLESVDPGLALHEGADRVLALELILALPAQLHELPADSVAHRRQLDSRAARIAGERDSLDAVVLDDGVDDQPALRVGRADQLDAEPSRTPLVPPSQATT